MAVPLIAIGAATISGNWILNNLTGNPLDWLNQYTNPSITSVKTTGGDNSIGTYNNKGYNFVLVPLMPSNKDIKAIDDFFEAYGYRVDRWGTVNLKVRSNFTFIKCKDVQIKGSHNRATDQLKTMLIKGCRFWNHDIGNY